MRIFMPITQPMDAAFLLGLRSSTGCIHNLGCVVGQLLNPAKQVLIDPICSRYISRAPNKGADQGSRLVQVVDEMD